MFGFQDTTNIVKRLWHCIKYALFHRMVNICVCVCEAFIGDSNTNDSFGKMILIECFKDKEALST